MEVQLSFYLIFLVLFLIGLSIGVSAVAGQRNRSPLAWFFISLICSPLMAILYLSALPIETNLETDGRVSCPRCCERIRSYAKVCPFCGVERTSGQNNH